MRKGALKELRRVEQDIRELALDRKWTRALKRLQAGERRWSDFCFFWDDAREESWRLLMVALPGSALARGSEAARAFGQGPWATLTELSAHVPGAPLSDACAKLIGGSVDGWKSPVLNVAIEWAEVRFMLGDDEGVSLRRACWDQVGDYWTPSRLVVATVGQSGDPGAKTALNRLVAPITTCEGATLVNLGVAPSGRRIYRDSKVRTGQ